jgi:hypothetical protein
VILNSQSSNQYSVFVVPGDYAGSQPLNLTASSANCFESYTHQSLAGFNLDISRGDFDILSTQQCLDTFAASYVHGFKSLAILSSNLTWDMESPIRFAAHANLPSSYDASYVPWNQYPFLWMCPRSQKPPCLPSNVQAQAPDWKISASIWQEPAWVFTVPWDNGTKTFNQANYTHCAGESPLCDNMAELAAFVWPTSVWSNANGYQYYTPITSQDLQTFTTTPSIWEKSLWIDDSWEDSLSWAKKITWQQEGLRCTNFLDLNSASLFGASNTEDFDYHSLGLYTVDGCLSTRAEEKCQLLFNPIFSIIVIVCTATKVACILFVSQRERARRLLTVGDAIVSFLSCPDPFTIGRCTSSSSDWIKPNRTLMGKSLHTYEGVPQQRLDCRTRRWWQAVAPRQWGLTLVLYVTCLKSTKTY